MGYCLEHFRVSWFHFGVCSRDIRKRFNIFVWVFVHYFFPFKKLSNNFSLYWRLTQYDLNSDQRLCWRCRSNNSSLRFCLVLWNRKGGAFLQLCFSSFTFSFSLLFLLSIFLFFDSRLFSIIWILHEKPVSFRVFLLFLECDT